MNLKEQQYICTLADTESMTEAAKKLGISQPALSLFVSNLEKSLGVKLFERVGKRLILTYVGELYTEKARQMLNLKALFDAELPGIIKGYKGRLRIGMQSFRSPHITPILLKKFKNDYPNVEIVLHEGNYRYLESLLLDNQIDLFFCNCPNQNQKIQYISLRREPILLATPPNHPKLSHSQRVTGSKYPWIDLGHFQKEQFILPYEGQSLRASVNQILDDTGIKPAKLFCVRSIGTSLRMTAEGMGISFCNESYTTYFDFNKKPAFFHVGNHIHTTEFVAAYGKGRTLPGYATHLINIIRDIL
ncbi:MAG: LysR family transcriptional regulator [Thermoanaerobacteraceae bacterium]|nr:LysR family transcriptional regulator [Thermoanaerobacteraceae bacterium]